MKQGLTCPACQRSSRAGLNYCGHCGAPLDAATVCFVIGRTPTREILQDLLNQLATINAGWFLEEWALGRKPPVSTLEAELRWLPDQPANSAILQDAPTIIRRGYGSCGPLAAMDVGAERAGNIIAGIPAHIANHQHRVSVRPTERPNEYHALQFDSKTRIIRDPARLLQRLEHPSSLS